MKNSIIYISSAIIVLAVICLIISSPFQIPEGNWPAAVVDVGLTILGGSTPLPPGVSPTPYGGGGSGSSGSFIPMTGVGVHLNSGNPQTDSSKIALSFDAGSDVVKVAVSNSLDFSGVTPVDFQPTMTWNLPNGDGPKSVFVKFYNSSGVATQIFSSNIVLNTGSMIGSIPNLPSGGSIGSASSTVDIMSTFTVNQTTPGQNVTLPIPTAAVTGKTIYVDNTGTVPFTMYGVSIPVGNGLAITWNGAAWVAGGLTGGLQASYQLAMNTLGSVNISDLPGGGSIGDASQTVDKAATFNVNQTTPGQTLTLPVPTVAVTGKTVYVNNTGTVPFTMYGVSIPVGSGLAISWNGSAWVSVGLTGGASSNFQLAANTSGSLNIANLSAGGSIGDASNTVDKAATFNVNQTTPGQSVTLPSPTSVTAGKTVYVNNTGTVPFTMYGVSIPVGSGLAISWNGSAWVSVGLTGGASSNFQLAANTSGSLNIANLSAGGSIGDASSTVDKAATFNVNQTTPGQSVTLPSPTSVTAGKTVYVNNTGTVPFTMYGVSIPVGSGLAISWNGSAWVAAGLTGGQSSGSNNIASNSANANNNVPSLIADNSSAGNSTPSGGGSSSATTSGTGTSSGVNGGTPSSSTNNSSSGSGSAGLGSNGLASNQIVTVKDIEQAVPRATPILEKLGMSVNADAKTLQAYNIMLPGIKKAIGVNVATTPLSQFTPDQQNKIPNGAVFALLGKENIDAVTRLDLSDLSSAKEKVNIVSGGSIVLVTKVSEITKSVTGKIVFKSMPQRKLSIKNNTFSLFPIAFAAESGEALIKRQLQVLDFDYVDGGNNTFVARINAPGIPGNYEISTDIVYKRTNASKHIVTTAVIDPAGYIYEKVNGKELRISNAIITLYKLNDKNQYDIWPANDYSQLNPQVTDETGGYSFLVPAGTYSVSVKAPGYGSYKSEPFSVIDGKEIYANVELKKTARGFSINYVDIFLIIILLITLANFFNEWRVRHAVKVAKSSAHSSNN